MPTSSQSQKSAQRSDIKLSDHSLIIIQDTDPGLDSTSGVALSEISKSASIPLSSS